MALKEVPAPAQCLLLLLLWAVISPITLSSAGTEKIDEDSSHSTPVLKPPAYVQNLYSHNRGSEDHEKFSESNISDSSKPSRDPSSLQPALTCTAQCPLCPTCPSAPSCPAACPTCPTCKRHIPPGYEYFPGHGYYRLHLVPVNWMDAKETCEREGAHLAIINSLEEANILKNLFARDPKMGDWFHLGFHDLYQEGKYVTVLGSLLANTGYTIWERGQPDNHHNQENCGSMYPSGGLNDLDCSFKEPFVCELPD